jgi:hypothetical protein
MVHLSELDDDGGGWPWGHREVESRKGAAGEVGDVGKKSRGRGPPAPVTAEREGRGTSMSSMTPVEARGGNSGAAMGALGSRVGEGNCRVTSAMPGSRVGDGGRR